VLGIREYAKQHRALVRVIDDEHPSETLATFLPKRGIAPLEPRSPKTGQQERQTYNLFAFPGESNFSGKKLEMDLVHQVSSGALPKQWKERKAGSGCADSKKSHWLVCVDAAKFCATGRLDLQQFPADFVALSLYKIIGYPTGLGALVVRNEVGNLLQKRYFGGGTVEASISDADFWRERKDLSERLEDGTVNFLDICSIRHGFDLLDTLGGIERVSEHVGVLAAYLFAELSALTHPNGKKVCVIYGFPEALKGETKAELLQRVVRSGRHGSIVSFNVQDSKGEWVGYSTVERLANVFGIQIRTGCFCNPGACQKYLNLSKETVRSNLEAGHVCWDQNDIINMQPTGAVRVSLGYMTTKTEVDRFISFLGINFVEEKKVACNLMSASRTTGEAVGIISKVILYPVKSCAGMEVSKWSLSRTGLLYDRNWAIVNARGVALTMKRVPKMSLIQPRLDLKRGILTLNFEGMQPLEIPINEGDSLVNVKTDKKQQLRETRICSSKCETKIESANDADRWLQEVLGQPCSLVRMRAPRQTKSRKREMRANRHEKEPPAKAELSFANEGQFLLVSEASVKSVADRMIKLREAACDMTEIDTHMDYRRYRPNFVVTGLPVFHEDSWTRIKVKSQQKSTHATNMDVIGPCVRCQMVDVDPISGDRKSKLLRTLATFRKSNNQIIFGVLLQLHSEAGNQHDGRFSEISVEDKIFPTVAQSEDEK